MEDETNDEYYNEEKAKPSFADLLTIDEDDLLVDNSINLNNVKLTNDDANIVASPHTHTLNWGNESIANGYSYVVNYNDTVEQFKEMIEIQKQDGNWNYDPYMHGLLNGMLLGLSTITGEEFTPYESPDEWICNKKHKMVSPQVATNCDEGDALDDFDRAMALVGD